MSKRTVGKEGICVLCGERSIVTREHVPPKNLFLAPRPRNSITVPVCGPCNHSHHLDDEYFRVYVTVGAEPGTRLSRLWKEKVVGSSFVRGGGLQAQLNNEHAELVAHHRQDPVRLIDGSALPDDLLHLAQPFPRKRIDSIVTKIVRCLNFHLTGTIMPIVTQFAISNAPLSASDAELLYNTPTGQVGEHGEFNFWSNVAEGGTGRWLLGFYGVKTFTVEVVT